MMEADNGKMYPLDLFFHGIAQRSLSLISGFCLLLKNKNIVSSLSLIRLHLDSLLQSYGAWLVKNPHDFASKKIAGKETKKIIDKYGKKMTDGYLRRTFFSDENNKNYRGVEKVYKETSGFIHFSDKHIFSGFSPIKNNIFNTVLSKNMDIDLKDEYIAVDCMVIITTGILRYLYSWIRTKEKIDLDKKH